MCVTISQEAREDITLEIGLGNLGADGYVEYEGATSSSVQ